MKIQSNFQSPEHRREKGRRAQKEEYQQAKAINN